MGGTLDGFDKDGSSADDFFFREKTPYSLRWNPKDLETFPINGKESLGETGKLKFVGTLRPLYAQEMQRRALTDLSRVGLPVAPALGINATVTAWIRTKNADDPFRPIQVESTTLATIIPSRAGQKEGHRVLLRRRFFNELIDQLHQIDLDDLKEDDAEFLRDIRKEGGTDKLYDGFLRTGGLTKAKGKLGTGLRLGDRPDSRQDAPWLQIVLRVSDELMEELRTIDPLVDALY